MIITLLKKTRLRRALSGVLVLAGALLLLLAPETRAGAFLLMLGIAIEALGIALKQRD